MNQKKIGLTQKHEILNVNVHVYFYMRKKNTVTKNIEMIKIKQFVSASEFLAIFQNKFDIRVHF